MGRERNHRASSTPYGPHHKEEPPSGRAVPAGTGLDVDDHLLAHRDPALDRRPGPAAASPSPSIRSSTVAGRTSGWPTAAVSSYLPRGLSSRLRRQAKSSIICVSIGSGGLRVTIAWGRRSRKGTLGLARGEAGCPGDTRIAASRDSLRWRSLALGWCRSLRQQKTSLAQSCRGSSACARIW